jgi:lipopolysaccharide biosynthesis glycosyltransferase
MSLDRWRAHGLGDRVHAFRRATPDARELDQDAINVAISGDVALVDPRWNVQTPAFESRWPRIPEADDLPSPFSWETVREVRRDPWIVHFTTDRKPWRPRCENPMQREWLGALSRTAWTDTRPELLPGSVRMYRGSRRAVGRMLHRYVDGRGLRW